MKKILLGIGALVLGLSFAGEASAQGPGRPGVGRPGVGRPGPGRPGPGRPYARTYYGARPYHFDNGVRFSGGYYFRGRDHSHWSHRVWSPVYRRYHYFDPYLSAYYYYCPVTLRYLPVPVVIR